MVHFAHFRKVNVSAGLRSVTFLRAAGAKRRGPTFSDQWNLCSARRLSRAAAELGNRQSRKRPHGVMPGRLFATRPRHRSEQCDGGARIGKPPDSPRGPDSPAAFLESSKGYPARGCCRSRRSVGSPGTWRLAIQVCDGAGDPNTAQTKTAIARAARNGTANSLKVIERDSQTAILRELQSLAS